MASEQVDYSGQAIAELNLKVRGIEERQKILKDQILLLGQNLVEIKEKSNQKTIEIKKELENLKQNTERLNSFMEMISNEFSKFAKKEDLEILTKQAKMFQPLDYIQKERT
jgi:archaellum component FlaC